MQMNIPLDLKLDFIGYFLRSMDYNCKITTTLSNLCGVLHIPLKKLDQLLTTLKEEGIIVYEEQEMCYLFALKTNPQVEDLVSLYQIEGKKHHGSDDYGKNKND